MTHAAAWGPLLAALLLFAADHAVAADAADGQRAYEAGRFAQARQIWTTLAQAGDPHAQLGLGYLDDLGKDAPRQPAKAFMWYVRAGDAGLAEAQFNAAAMLDSGFDIARDRARAAVWYAKAAAHGHRRAQYDLAQLYEAGDGVPRNLAQAAVWYRAAADGGITAARAKLAEIEQEIRASGTPDPGRDEATLVPAQADAPPGHAELDGRRDPPSIELVWSAPAEPVPTTFFVQVMVYGQAGTWQELLARYVDQTALLVRLGPAPAYYAWRVYVVAPQSQHYAAGSWSRFEVRSPP